MPGYLSRFFACYHFSCTTFSWVFSMECRCHLLLWALIAYNLAKKHLQMKQGGANALCDAFLLCCAFTPSWLWLWQLWQWASFYIRLRQWYYFYLDWFTWHSCGIGGPGHEINWSAEPQRLRRLWFGCWNRLDNHKLGSRRMTAASFKTGKLYSETRPDGDRDLWVNPSTNN